MRLDRKFLVLLSALLMTAPAAAQTPSTLAPPALAPSPALATETPSPSPGTETPQLTRTDLEAWLDGFLPYALQRGGIAGAVVSVVKDGQVVLTKGYGYADVEKRIPVDGQQTLFRPGSVSKSA